MKNFFTELHSRNPVLSWFGRLNILAAVICLILIQTDPLVVLGINAFIKPMKFFLSIAILRVDHGMITYYLDAKRRVYIYSWAIALIAAFETVVITWQAANGRRSHFNNDTLLYGVLFSLMGAAISTLVVWTGYITWLFFRQKEFSISNTYLWGIRLGLVLFVIFSFEGFVIVHNNAHTVGSTDGGPGVLLFNWSLKNGDLRVAHFFGMHSLQLLPLFGNYLASNPRQVKWLAAGYFILCFLLLVQATNGIPLFF